MHSVLGIVGIGRVQRAVHMDQLSASSQKNMSSRRDSWKREAVETIMTANNLPSIRSPLAPPYTCAKPLAISVSSTSPD